MASRRRAPVAKAASVVAKTQEPELDFGGIAAVLVACALIVWRAQAYPLKQFWHDWVVIVSAYLIATVTLGRSRAWPMLTVGVMAFLLGVFAWGHLPKMLGMYEWLP